MLDAPNLRYYSERYIQGDDRWSNRNLEVEMRTIRDELKHCFDPGKQLRILDIGCGKARLSRRLRAELESCTIHITGIDFVPNDVLFPVDQIEVGEGFTLVEEDFFAWQSGDKFDVLLDLGLFHHLPPDDWSRYGRNAVELMNEESVLFLTAFNTNDQNNPSRGMERGHERRGYWCHYHNRNSVQSVFPAHKVTEAADWVDLGHAMSVYQVSAIQS